MAELNAISLRELSLVDTQNTGLIGKVVAKRYHIDKELGKGKYGIALQVSDREDNNMKKVLKRVQIASCRDIQTVRQEAGILSSLNHKYIVQFLSSFFDGDWFCIIMELCEGGTLATKIEYAKSEQLPIDAQDILRWTYQVLDGLQYAHSRDKKVLHRDIKPSNILLVGNDAKLSDFGCSKQLDASTYQASSIVGTILYLAPEVHNDQVYSDKSDVWSVGCILYELFTLQPICGSAAVAMQIIPYLKHMDTMPTPTLPDERFQDLFLRMMEKDPRNRASAAEVLEDRHFEVFQTNNGSNAGSEGLTIELVDDD
uniref:non-specific serine/threonine protein kinase n=3 Tax=Ciona intestinalis TaxID=7719 RepID=F6W8V2_CIOIN